jgi:hypothetical protein
VDIRRIKGPLEFTFLKDLTPGESALLYESSLFGDENASSYSVSEFEEEHSEDSSRAIILSFASLPSYSEAVNVGQRFDIFVPVFGDIAPETGAVAPFAPKPLSAGPRPAYYT